MFSRFEVVKSFHLLRLNPSRLWYIKNKITLTYHSIGPIYEISRYVIMEALFHQEPLRPFLRTEEIPLLSIVLVASLSDFFYPQDDLSIVESMRLHCQFICLLK